VTVALHYLPIKGDQEITVSFERGGIKKLLLSLAPLGKIEPNY